MRGRPKRSFWSRRSSRRSTSCRSSTTHGVRRGPLPTSSKRRFGSGSRPLRAASTKQHQEHFEALKAEQVKTSNSRRNFAPQPRSSTRSVDHPQEWNKASERLLEIQKTWKTIGFAPKRIITASTNGSVRPATSSSRPKRAFYAGVKTEMEHNLQLKVELCEQA